MIEIKGLCHSFGNNKVLEDVNLTVKDSCVLGLIGINGAGKSTLLRSISGVYKPLKGSVEYDGKSPASEKTRQDIFLLPDDPYFGMQTNCRSLIKMYKVFYPSLDEKLYKEMITGFNLNARKPLRTFSKGMRRQAFVALAFAVAPKYLLLDEAFDGLDPYARQKFKEQLLQLVKDKGSTVIISSHSLKELEDFCDEYAMIDEHHVVSSGKMLEKTMDYLKYQLAFSEIPSANMFEEFKVKSMKITGRVVTLVVEGKQEDIESKLQSLAPLIVDKLDVNFEEAFIGDIDKKIREGDMG